MGRMKYRAFLLIVHSLRFLIPRAVRCPLIKALLLAEHTASPQDSIRRLFEVHAFVEHLIDDECIRWGQGIHIKHQLIEFLHSFFYERIPDGARVLDVGCGIGAIAQAIVTHRKAKVVAVDMNAQRIAFARARFEHPDLQFQVADATQSLPGEKFDAIVLSSVLEHIENRVHLLRALTARFQPEKFLIRVPTFERHPYAVIKKELGLFAYTDPTHCLEYSPESFRDEMEEAGLRVHSIEVRLGDIWAVCVPTHQPQGVSS